MIYIPIQPVSVHCSHADIWDPFYVEQCIVYVSIETCLKHEFDFCVY